MKVLAIINDGFEETESIAPFDILRRANINLTIASNKNEAKGSHDITFKNLELLKNINYKEYDLLILPGGPQWINNEKDELYLEIASYFAKYKKVAAICAAPTILGKLGFLKNKKYTCFPPLNEDFGGTFTGSSYEIDDNIITGRSAGSSLDFGYAILESLTDNNTVKKIKDSMFY